MHNIEKLMKGKDVCRQSWEESKMKVKFSKAVLSGYTPQNDGLFIQELFFT